jgi:tellurite resistance protein TehA-like permease
VVAARLSAHEFVLWVLAGMALQGWLSLAPVVVRQMWRDRIGLRDRAHGGWELASVATSGLAIVMADLKIVFLAMLLWVVAIAVYLVMTGLTVWRSVHESSGPGLLQPDIWILMGGAAIATLAGDHIDEAGLTFVWPVTVVTWVVATAWIPVLVYLCMRHRIGLAWPAVFPLGMYSSATYATAVETGWQWLTIVSLVFFWIAFAAWVIVAVESIVEFRRARVADTPSGPTT